MAPMAQEQVGVEATGLAKALRPSSQLVETLVAFAAGAVYGVTSVAVGQPLDTIKTRMQARSDSMKTSTFRTGIDLLRAQGIAGLYRGGLPVVCGGTLFRSAQFGMYELTLKHLKDTTPAYKIGPVDMQVALAGAAGGVARGVIEAPFDRIKVTRQVEQAWTLRTLFEGSAVTIGRNANMFCAFSIYRDVIPPLIPGGLGPFWMGALCANLAWLTIWPLDVIKSQRQSGLFPNHSAASLLREAARGGILFRGLGAGIARSTIANGCAMVAYKRFEEFANMQLPRWR